jgi:hypothetical protein
MGKMFLIIIDAHSKWLDVHIMPSITSVQTIEKLRITFATHGLPQKVVTDNGPSFVSEQFKSFMSDNGIVHVTTAPYHPATNGLAERAVQTVKNGLKRTPGTTVQEKLSKFLFTYRITPQTTTGVAPAQLLMNRCPRSRLDRLFPDLSERVAKHHAKQAEQHDTSKPLRTFAIGDTVYVKDFSTPSPTWIGIVTKVTGPLSYHVELQSGCIVRRHVDAVRRRDVLVSASGDTSHGSTDDFYLPDLPPTGTATDPPTLPTVPPTVHPPSSAPPTRRRRRAYPPASRRSNRHRPPPKRM